MNIKKATLPLSNGETAIFEYDAESDLLEIIFAAGEATAAIELTESMILRFDWETGQPRSLSLISLSHLLQPSAFGNVHFELLIEEWPEEVKEKVWAMLQEPPLSNFLKIGGYAPAHQQAMIPIASITQQSFAVPALA